MFKIFPNNFPALITKTDGNFFGFVVIHTIYYYIHLFIRRPLFLNISTIILMPAMHFIKYGKTAHRDVGRIRQHPKQKPRRQETNVSSEF